MDLSERDKEHVQEMFRKYKIDTEGVRKKGKLTMIKEALQYALLVEESAELFYTLMYELFCGSEHPRLTGKERGQLKHLLSFYEPKIVFSIIVEYFRNLNNYTFDKGVPSVGNLLYQKEKIRLNIKKPIKTKKETTLEEGF